MSTKEPDYRANKVAPKPDNESKQEDTKTRQHGIVAFFSKNPKVSICVFGLILLLLSVAINILVTLAIHLSLTPPASDGICQENITIPCVGTTELLGTFSKTFQADLKSELNQLATEMRSNFTQQLQATMTEILQRIDQLTIDTHNNFTQQQEAVRLVNNTLLESTSALQGDLTNLTSIVYTHYTENDDKLSAVHQNLSTRIAANKEDISQLKSDLNSTAEQLSTQHDQLAMETRSNFTRVEQIACQACNNSTMTLQQGIEALNNTVSGLDAKVNYYQVASIVTITVASVILIIAVICIVATCIVLKAKTQTHV